MEFEPKALEFRDVRLNQSYTTSLCITNTYPTPVDFTLLPSSSRYLVNPNRVNLSPGQSIVITVRLFLNHNPSYSEGTNSHDDTILIKSSYFEHQLVVSFSLNNKDTGVNMRQSMSMSTSTSMSPSLRNRVASNTSRSISPSTRMTQQNAENNASISKIKDLEKQLSAKCKTVQQLEVIVSQLESKYPSVQEVVRNRVEQERLSFEEKSEKVSSLTSP